MLAAIPSLQLVASALCLGGVAGAWWWRSWRVPWPTFAVGVVGIFGYHALLFTAFRLAPPVEANLVNYLWPLLIVLLSPLVVGGALRPRHVIGAALGFAGAALAISGGRVAFAAESLPGFACAALAALTWALYSLLTKRLPRFPSAAVSGFCLVSGLLAAAWSTASGQSWSWIGTLPMRGWLLLLALGLGPMGLAFVCWDAALKRGDPRVIGSLSYLAPLASTAMLALIAGLPPSRMALVALALIVAGAALGAMGGASDASRSAPGASTGRVE
jgi:drug/metabolite transporter (DMT)-like permease